MPRRALLFNPENDTALGRNNPGYTPPRRARQIAVDGSLLPLWWATDEDVVISPFVAEGEALKQRFGLKGTIAPNVGASGITECEPWGWSLYARRLFERAGVPDSALPAAERIEMIRQLSHRRLTITINREVAEILSDKGIHAFLPPTPRCITDAGEIAEINVPFYLKLPWSSSGRGVMRHDRADAHAIEVAAGMIRNQGSAMVEKALDRVEDFAALFYVENGAARYRGLSLFNTDATGAYIGNILDTEPRLMQRMTRFIELPMLTRHIEALETALTKHVAPHYTGWLGVDMMVYRTDSGRTAIAPCVEVNLRMTMGVVALLMRGNPVIAGMLPAQYTVVFGNGNAGGVDVAGARTDSSFRFSVRKF